MVFRTPWRFLLACAGFRDGKPRTEVVQNDRAGQKRSPLLQRLTGQRLKKAFFVLDLRQGTILIALLELIVLTFIGIMVVMVLLHVLEIEALIISEVEDSPARESIALSGLSGQEAIIAEVNNESRLQVGLDVAAYKVLGISCMLMSLFLHIVASALLMLGAILRKRGLLIMWMCTTTTDLSVILCGMIVSVAEVAFRGGCKLAPGIDLFVTLGFIGAVWLLHNMLVVSSLYFELFEWWEGGRSTNVGLNLHLKIRSKWNMDLDPDVEMLGSPGADKDVPAPADHDTKPAVEHNLNVLNNPLIPDLLPDPSSERSTPALPEVKLA